jgi:hypothetical protein
MNHEDYTSHKTAAQLMVDLGALTNLNARNLAELIKVSPSTVTRIKKGLVCPSYDDMLLYAHRAGYCVSSDGLERLNHLKGYKSAKEIGDFVNSELEGEGTLDPKALRVVLRVVPKLVYDWKDLPSDDIPKMMLPCPKVVQPEWQALIEGIVQFFSHSELLADAPRWTYRTKLRETFVPRATGKILGKLRMDRMFKRAAVELVEKNIVFSKDEMQLV